MFLKYAHITVFKSKYAIFSKCTQMDAFVGKTQGGWMVARSKPVPTSQEDPGYGK